MNQIIRAGFINIIGPPNSGKSTLINYLIGKKISIVSPKAQTTRFCIRGILNHSSENEDEKCQMIFIDTPGMFRPKRSFDQVIFKNAFRSISDVDHSIFIIDSNNQKSLRDFFQIIKSIPIKKNKISLVLNKIDLIDKITLLEMTKNIMNFFYCENVFMISALNGDGCEDLVNFLIKKMPESNFLYDEDYLTDIPKKVFASEITREKLFKYLSYELPYNLTVQTTEWSETDSEIKIYQNVYVSKSNHKIILIGKKGENIKKISIISRLEMSKIFKKKIHLFLYVILKKNWVDNPKNFSFLGVNPNA